MPGTDGFVCLLGNRTSTFFVQTGNSAQPGPVKALRELSSTSELARSQQIKRHVRDDDEIPIRLKMCTNTPQA